MLKQSKATAAALVGLLAPALCRSAEVPPRLAGSYVYYAIQICTNGTPPTQNTSQANGTIKFDPSSGLARESIFTAVGSPLHEQGTFFTARYSTTRSLLILGGIKYRVTYGASTNGRATYAVLLGIVPESNCSIQGSLTSTKPT